MIEKVCNLWLERAEYRCIPTTGAVGGDGAAVMDSGLAKEAAQRFSGLELDLGRLLTSRGNHVHLVRPDLISFPIQQFQWSGPSLQVIGRSAHELVALVGEAKTLLPRPGCAEGQLPWEEVAKVLEFLPDNVIVIQHT
ncbi:MAG: ADP-ribose-binding protein [Phycisphaerae bacterium]|nr:ADP-ribose-binding protein [Phycisphaerae bacterium]